MRSERSWLRLGGVANPPDTAMLREISAAADRERTGALDVHWDGAHATLFFSFGHPSHAVFETVDGRALVGEPALDAIVTELPADFRVAPWRRAMVTDATLHCTAEDLMGMFQRRNAVDSNESAPEQPAPPDQSAEAPPAETAVTAADVAAVPGDQPTTPPAPNAQPPFGLTDFPVLPLATTLWSDAAANVRNLEAAVPRLPDSVIVLSDAGCQGVVLIAAGELADAVWVSPHGGRLGADAAHAVMSSEEGTLTAYTFDDPRIAGALPMLWRARRTGLGVPGHWLHIDELVAEVRTSSRSCCLVVASADPGVALFVSGELVAVYTAAHRWPATSMASLRSLLHDGDAVVTVVDGLAAQAGVTTVLPDTSDADAGAVVAPPAGVEPAPEAEVDAADDGATEPVADALAEAAPEAVVDTLAETAPEAVADAPTEAAPEAVADTPAETAPEAAMDAPAEAAAPDEAIAAEDDAVQVAEAAADTTAAAEIAPTFDTEVPADALEPAPAEAATEAPQEARATLSWRHRRGRGRRGRKPDEAVVEPAEAVADPVEAAPAPVEAEPVAPAHAEAPPVAVAPPAEPPVPAVEEEHRFAPALFAIEEPARDASLDTIGPVAEDFGGMAAVEAREQTEFVPARLDIDVDALRSELSGIAAVWLGEEDAVPVARAIAAARPGVDDFVSTIKAIAAMEIPGHESAVLRAMAREMHFRASEVLCGV
jgi:hypothetical protein